LIRGQAPIYHRRLQWSWKNDGVLYHCARDFELIAERGIEAEQLAVLDEIKFSKLRILNYE
jgi:hypothetical protein